MSQEEVMRFLNQHPKGWWHSKELAAALDISPGSVIVSLAKLRHAGFVHWKNVMGTKKRFMYKAKSCEV